MNLNNVITGSPVTSGELRAARDQRVLKNGNFLPRREICLVEFSLNIAGQSRRFPSPGRHSGRKYGNCLTASPVSLF